MAELRAARRRTAPAMTVPASARMGELIARAAMLAAIAESRPFKRFLGLFCCSMRCAVACESIPQLLIGFEESSASCVRDAGQANWFFYRNYTTGAESQQSSGPKQNQGNACERTAGCRLFQGLGQLSTPLLRPEPPGRIPPSRLLAALALAVPTGVITIGIWAALRYVRLCGRTTDRYPGKTPNRFGPVQSASNEHRQSATVSFQEIRGRTWLSAIQWSTSQASSLRALARLFIYGRLSVSHGDSQNPLMTSQSP